MSNEQRYRVYLCGGPHCSSKGMAALQQHLELEIWDRELDTAVEVCIGGCQDQCDYGPNMIVWPGSYRYAGLTRQALTRIVEQHLLNGEPVASLLAHPSMRR